MFTGVMRVARRLCRLKPRRLHCLDSVHPPANPFSAKKEIRRGEISEKCKGGGWWGAARLAVLGGVATSALCAKMGSSEFKKSLQVGSSNKSRPLKGDFLFFKKRIYPNAFSVFNCRPTMRPLRLVWVDRAEGEQYSRRNGQQSRPIDPFPPVRHPIH